MAGRLDGFVSGRPLSLLAEENQFTIVPSHFRTLLELLKIRRSCLSVILPLQTALRKAEITVYVRLGWIGKVQLLPEPSFLLRPFLPR